MISELDEYLRKNWDRIPPEEQQLLMSLVVGQERYQEGRLMILFGTIQRISLRMKI